MATMIKSEDTSEDTTATPNERTPSAATIENEDELLFGSMNSEIADALADRIHAAVAEGVESLPLLSDKEKAQSLVKSIEQTYMDNVDIMETYGSQNIFTIRPYKPRRRQRILQACLQDLPLKNNHTTSMKADSSSPQEEEAYPEYPSKDEIPSPQETAALQNELCQLKERLDAARLRRNDLLAKEKSLESAIAVSNAAVQSLVVVSNHQVHEPVAKAVSDGKTMQELTKEGKELIQQLDDSKRERSSEDDENDGIIPRTNLNKKKKRKSLEEEYKLDRQVLQTKNVDSLQALRSMLKKK
jgi:hypothetical protein